MLDDLAAAHRNNLEHKAAQADSKREHMVRMLNEAVDSIARRAEQDRLSIEAMFTQLLEMHDYERNEIASALGEVSHVQPQIR
jgi:hypothetical protein